MYRGGADSEFWDAHWRREMARADYSRAAAGDLAHFTAPFLEHLPRGGRILEAGCGLGKVVMALRARGYACEGVDFSRETVAAVQRRFPELPIKQANVCSLRVPDAYYHGYISLGVVEHSFQGPAPFLAEARRVLSPAGVMLLAVPYFNPLRRLKAMAGLYPPAPKAAAGFYQYAFPRREMLDIIATHGFLVRRTYYYGAFEGARAEVPGMRRLLRFPRVGWRLERWLQRCSPWVRPCAHMILFACEKR